MRIIENIAEHIEQTDGIHGFFTGTFDPSHVGHVRALRDAIDTGKIDASIIVLPHSVNPAKKPIDLATRRRWFAMNVQEFASDLDEFVVIAGEEVHSPNQIGSLVERYKKRLLRISGSDKGIEGETQLRPGQREPGLSSSIIKQQIAQRNLDALKGKVAVKVLEEILQFDHYRNVSPS